MLRECFCYSDRDTLNREVSELKKSQLLMETSLAAKTQKLEELYDEVCSLNHEKQDLFWTKLRFYWINVCVYYDNYFCYYFYLHFGFFYLFNLFLVLFAISVGFLLNKILYLLRKTNSQTFFLLMPSIFSYHGPKLHCCYFFGLICLGFYLESKQCQPLSCTMN